MKVATIHAVLSDAVEIAVNTDRCRRMYPPGLSPFHKQKCGSITFHQSSVEPRFAFWNHNDINAAAMKIIGLSYDKSSCWFTYTPSSLTR